MSEQDTFEFKLSTPIEVYKGNSKNQNEIVKCDTLYLKAPTHAHNRLILSLQQGFMKRQVSSMACLGELTDAEERKKQEEERKLKEKLLPKQEAQEIDAKDVKSALLYANMDINSYIDLFKKFAATGICYTDESYINIIKDKYFDKMSSQDCLNLVSEYIAFFLIASWQET